MGKLLVSEVREIETLSPFSSPEANKTRVKRTASFSAKANDTSHLQETLDRFETPSSLIRRETQHGLGVYSQLKPGGLAAFAVVQPIHSTQNVGPRQKNAASPLEQVCGSYL